MNVKLFAIVTFIVLTVFVTAWQFYFSFSPQLREDYNTNTTGATNTSNTIESISNDLNQIPDASSLNSELDSLNESIEGF